MRRDGGGSAEVAAKITYDEDDVRFEKKGRLVAKRKRKRRGEREEE